MHVIQHDARNGGLFAGFDGLCVPQWVMPSANSPVRPCVYTLRDADYVADRLHDLDCSGTVVKIGDMVELTDLRGQVTMLESLRPVWAQGFSSDSVAAQTATNALSQIWDMLGVKNQTAAVERLRMMLEANRPAQPRAEAEQSDKAAAAGGLPAGWTVEWDTYSAPGTIRLNSGKWGGSFISEPKPHDISMPALMFRLLRDILNDRTPVADAGGKTPEIDALMARWDDDGATRGAAFIELRDKARQLERAYYIVVEQCRELAYTAAAADAVDPYPETGPVCLGMDCTCSTCIYTRK